MARKELDSKKSFEGAIRKFIILCVVLAAWLLQYMLARLAHAPLAEYLPDVPANVPLGEFVGGYFNLYLFFSILENSVRAGVKLPRQLRNALKIVDEDEATNTGGV